MTTRRKKQKPKNVTYSIGLTSLDAQALKRIEAVERSLVTIGTRLVSLLDFLRIDFTLHDDGARVEYRYRAKKRGKNNG